MASKRDYYEVLGVERTATAEVITKSYRKLAMQYHPDRNPGDEQAEACFKEAAEAYSVLCDESKRARYDRYGHAGLDGMGGGNSGFQDVGSIFDLFGDLFGGGGGGQRSSGGGRDVHAEVVLSLTEAYRGVRKSVTLPRDEPCRDCGGSGARRGTRPATCQRCNGHGAVIMQQGFFRVQQTCRACGGAGQIVTDPCHSCQGRGAVRTRRAVEVDIPAGVDTGMRIRVPREGEAGRNGQPTGDLYLVVKLKEHNLFQRDGQHLICQVPVSFAQAALGGDLDVPTLEGKMLYPLPRGIQSGEVLRIFRKGMPDVHNPSSKGDLLVQVMVETPKHLTKRQEELFRELAELDKGHVTPARKSFFDRVKDFFSGEPAVDEAVKS